MSVSLLTGAANLRRLIDAAADWSGLPGFRDLTGRQLLEGLVLTESSGRPAVVRYESHHDRANRKDARTDGDTPDRDDGMREDDRSYGLTQVLGSNIRRLVGVPDGTPMDFSFALFPATNLDLGLRVLFQEIRTVQRKLGRDSPNDAVIERALARYNGGPTGDFEVDGDIRLRAYVERVYQNALLAQRDRAEKGWGA